MFYRSINNLLTAKYTYEDGNFITEEHNVKYNNLSKPNTATITYKDTDGNSFYTIDYKYLYY